MFLDQPIPKNTLESDKTSSQNLENNCDAVLEPFVMPEVAILHQALISAREGDLQTLQVVIVQIIKDKTLIYYPIVRHCFVVPVYN